MTSMRERKQAWKSFISSNLLMDIKAMGENLRLTRKRQGKTQATVAQLIGVDPRVISNIEKGAPEGSVGIYFQYMQILGLLKGWQMLFDPEIDIQSLREEIKRYRKSEHPRYRFSDNDLDF